MINYRYRRNLGCNIATLARRKKRAIEMFGHQCAYCGIYVRDVNITVDHIIPISQGGNSNLSNLAIACRPCNNVKGNNVWETQY